VELREELDEARRNNDPGAAERIECELEVLRREIQAAAGAGGRLRRAADDRERVRKSVGAAIRRAIDDIGEFDRPLADHLRRRVRGGAHPRYEPDQGVRWET
jgi:hypothetical protein